MITVYGVLGTPSDDIRDHVARADTVVGGTRHLDLLDVEEPKRIVMGALTKVVEQLSALPADSDIVMLASGDPLWFGVVRKLRAYGLRPVVKTAASSVAQAFARVGLPWDDAVTVSAHGRPIEPAIAAARKYTKVAVMTDPREPLATLAEPLIDAGRTFVLAERLGETDERVRITDATELAGLDDVRHPNVVLILQRHPDDEWPEDSEAVDVAEPRRAQRGAVTPRLNRGLDELVIGQVAGSKNALGRVERIDEILDTTTKVYEGSSTEGLRQAFSECDIVISHLALGATTRVIAPLLESKHSDPAVLVIDQGGRFVVPLVGGHVGGANDIAEKLAAGLDATPVVTTATDALGIPALDNLGWPHSGDVAQVTSAMLDGESVALHTTQPWPLPPLPKNVRRDADEPVTRIVVTDTADEPGDLPQVTLYPQSLVVGMGCNRGTDVTVLRELLDQTLQAHNLSVNSVTALTSVDVKDDEIGMHKLATQLGVPFVTYPAEALNAQQVPNPSTTVAGEVGTPSVAEASVQAHGAKLIVEKQKNPDATCAIGRLPARGKLSVVGLGPGSRDLLTPMASDAIKKSSVVVGYAPYVRQVRDLISPYADIKATKMGTEEQRVSYAIDQAREGHYVSIVCSGDPAIYAMASPTLELGTEGIDVQIVPGVTAELAASALLGAPLGHDHVTISLSDLHTTWDDIERRLYAAAEGDFVTVLYNPRSKKRTMHLPRALEILGAHRPATTPVAMVRDAFRPRQEIKYAPLSEFDPTWVNMTTIVIVGSSTTKMVPTGDGEQVIVTPRDYTWMGDRLEGKAHD